MKNSTYCTLYLIRHGETEWNKQKRIQGQLDSPLTRKGIAGTKELAKKLHHIHFDAMLT